MVERSRLSKEGQQLLDDVHSLIRSALIDRRDVRIAESEAISLTLYSHNGDAKVVKHTTTMITEFPDNFYFAANKLKRLARGSPPEARREAYAAAGRLEAIADRNNPLIEDTE